jgi:hypothetical protein
MWRRATEELSTPYLLQVARSTETMSETQKAPVPPHAAGEEIPATCLLCLEEVQKGQPHVCEHPAASQAAPERNK